MSVIDNEAFWHYQSEEISFQTVYLCTGIRRKLIRLVSEGKPFCYGATPPTDSLTDSKQKVNPTGQWRETLLLPLQLTHSLTQSRKLIRLVSEGKPFCYHSNWLAYWLTYSQLMSVIYCYIIDQLIPPTDSPTDSKQKVHPTGQWRETLLVPVQLTHSLTDSLTL